MWTHRSLQTRVHAKAVRQRFRLSSLHAQRATEPSGQGPRKCRNGAAGRAGPTPCIVTIKSHSQRSVTFEPLQIAGANSTSWGGAAGLGWRSRYTASTATRLVTPRRA